MQLIHRSATTEQCELPFSRQRVARSGELDEIGRAHAAVGGRRRGRPWATRQLNHAFAVILCSHFQRFARDLHSEAVAALVRATPPDRPEIVLAILRRNRGRYSTTWVARLASYLAARPDGAEGIPSQLLIEVGSQKYCVAMKL